MVDRNVRDAGRVRRRPVEVLTGGAKAAGVVSVILGGLSMMVAQIWSHTSAQFFGGKFGAVSLTTALSYTVPVGLLVVSVVTLVQLCGALKHRPPAVDPATATGPYIGGGHMVWTKPSPAPVPDSGGITGGAA